VTAAETTIAAIASPPGPGLRGVIRISGARARELAAKCCRVDGRALALAGRGLCRARFDDGVGEQPALVLWMPAPSSYTREDVVELHLAGAPPLLAAALRRLFELGAEPAAPGEFTRRAFLNGRIDLTRAEGVLALVQARTEGERRAAAALLFGGLDQRTAALRDGLEALRALCEASLDFDEGDTGHVPASELAAGARRLGAALCEARSWEEHREAPRGAPRIVLSGAPNAGKSSLFNRLCRDARAIVDAGAGTTRDRVAGSWHVAGVECLLVDTAGVDPGAAGLEGRAQVHAAGERDAADLVLWVVDAMRPQLAGESPIGPGGPMGPGLYVWNKIDLPGAAQPSAGELPGPWLALSARTGQGVPALEAAVARALGLAGESGARAAPAAMGAARELAARHRRALAEAGEELERGLAELERGAPLDQFAESLRRATDALDRIRGRTTPEDLLDRIFAQFCLGK